MTDFFAAAEALRANSWPVFPCSPETKAPLLPKESATGAKDGGLHLASRDAKTVQSWWRRWPKAMIGVPTGRTVGAFVVDLDPKKVSADAMLQALRDWLGEPLPPCPVSRTQSGGLHLWFALPEGQPVGNRAGLFRKIADAPEEIREHVDIRGDGGYVIVPPSVMANGNVYAWEQEPEGGEPFPPAPQKLLDAIAKKLDGSPAPAAAPVPPLPSREQPAAARNEAQERARHKYAMAALEREIGELARTGEGARGYGCNQVGYSLGGLVGAGLLSETLVRAEMFAACERNGLVTKDGADKVRANITRSIAAGAAKPIDITDIGSRAGTSTGNARRAAGAARPLDPAPASARRPPGPSSDDQEDPASQAGAGAPKDPDGGVGDELEMRLALLPMTDLGNAQRFVARFGHLFLYVDTWGWLAYDGKRWNRDEADAMVARAVHDTVKAIAEEAHQVRAYDMLFDAAVQPRVNPIVDVKKEQPVFYADRLAGWCTASQSNAHVSCMAKLAQPYLTASPEDFDADKMALNVENGTLRFRKTDDGSSYVTFHAHRREDRMTKMAHVRYDREATCDLYDKFLERVQPDPAMRRHLHAWGGVTLTAMQIPKFAFWFGKGRNGKSVLADTWAAIVGDYCQTIPIESFLDSGRARQAGGASPDIAALPGVRMLRTSEPEKRSKLAESLIKLVTGGEALRARHLNKDFFEFIPVFKLVMQGNYRPTMTGTDEGIWARVMVVPWEVTIPEAERDPNLTVKLATETSGILNRLVDGLCDYLDNGLSPPDKVIEATQDYREDSDPVGRYLKDCTEPAPGERVAGGVFYKLFVAWAGANGEFKLGAKAFSRGIADHGIKRLKSSSAFYLDIKLTKTVADFAGESFSDEEDYSQYER